MNATIDNMVSRNVRRVSGLALVLMMACSPAMAAGKPTSSGAGDEPWVLSYRCDGNNLEMEVVSGFIPEGRRFDVDYVSASFFMSVGGPTPNLVVVEGFDASSLPMVMMTSLAPNSDIELIEKTVSFTFTQQPGSVHFGTLNGTLANTDYCNLQFHGKLGTL